ncbi:hypothetical protein PVAP13_8KG388715 [Panicum virgatum]|uniref:Uncharacterized protein n=1 Tax=Panicum virgatum TaxID=38727 RepID=A0A8T0PP67_PANVG|nr:hypothetical protein PVAP13_8KG388715 [Panicum virgatum]
MKPPSFSLYKQRRTTAAMCRPRHDWNKQSHRRCRSTTMAAHKFHSTTTFKAVVVLAIAALLFASTGYAAEATRPADNGFDAPPPYVHQEPWRRRDLRRLVPQPRLL